MKERYTVGEFSDMFHLNVQTLRYYDSIGLFSPVQRDARTGRRSYAFEQVYGLASIRFLRRLGYSLEGVQDYLNQRRASDTLDILKKRSAELHRQLEELQDLDGAIRRKIQYTEAALKEVETRGGVSAITIEEFGPRHYMPIGDEASLYYDDSFYFFPTVVFYHQGNKTFGAYLYQEKFPPQQEKGHSYPKPDLIPAGKYLCGYHCGPYDQVHQTESLLRDSHPDLRLSDVTIDFNIIDQFVDRDSESYLTGMQIQILGHGTE